MAPFGLYGIESSLGALDLDSQGYSALFIPVVVVLRFHHGFLLQVKFDV